MAMVGRWIALVLLAGLAGCTTTPGFTLSRGEDKSEKLARLARDVETSGGGETAFALYREAVAASGRTPAAYVQLGDAYLRGKRLSQAAEAYRAALAKDPDDAEAQLGIGTVLVRQGALQKGIGTLAKAAPLVNTGAAYNRLGVAQTMAGQFPEAQAAFEKGLHVEPSDIDIATNLALAAALAGDSEKAESLSHTIAKYNDVKAVHRRNLVIVLGIIGKSSKDARTVAPADLSQPEFDALFSRAASIRHISDPKARARVLGTMQG
jgi:Flp pilus assembly protein TadD